MCDLAYHLPGTTPSQWEGESLETIATMLQIIDERGTRSG